MAVLQILVYPDKRLKQVSQPVNEISKEIKSFIQDLEETFRSFPGCVGIAAPQVGRFERIILVYISHKPQHDNHGLLVLLNPNIILFLLQVIKRNFLNQTYLRLVSP